MNRVTLARKLYEVYLNAVGGFSHGGTKLPTTEEFFGNNANEKSINGWLAAADEAISLLSK